MLLRNSQTKFPSDDLTLNVIRCSTFGQGFLNRSIILLLHSLGVEIPYFLEKQRQAKDLIDVEKVKAKLAVYTEQMKSSATLTPEKQK